MIDLINLEKSIINNMENEITIDQILKKAFENLDPFIVNEIVKETTLSFLGSTNVDLYITVNKKYIEKRIRSNLVNIQRAITELGGKTVRDTYINQQKVEISIKELENKESIKTISVEDFKKERTAEISGENDIVKESGFKYDASILNKKVIAIEFHNKSMNKQYKVEINKTVLTNGINFIQRRKLVKKINWLLSLKYEPVNNDTQEVMDFLKIEK